MAVGRRREERKRNREKVRERLTGGSNRHHVYTYKRAGVQCARTGCILGQGRGRGHGGDRKV